MQEIDTVVITLLQQVASLAWIIHTVVKIELILKLCFGKLQHVILFNSMFQSIGNQKQNLCVKTWLLELPMISESARTSCPTTMPCSNGGTLPSCSRLLVTTAALLSFRTTTGSACLTKNKSEPQFIQGIIAGNTNKAFL